MGVVELRPRDRRDGFEEGEGDTAVGGDLEEQQLCLLTPSSSAALGTRGSHWGGGCEWRDLKASLGDHYWFCFSLYLWWLHRQFYIAKIHPTEHCLFGYFGILFYAQMKDSPFEKYCLVIKCVIINYFMAIAVLRYF